MDIRTFNLYFSVIRAVLNHTRYKIINVTARIICAVSVGMQAEALKQRHIMRCLFARYLPALRACYWLHYPLAVGSAL